MKKYLISLLTTNYDFIENTIKSFCDDSNVLNHINKVGILVEDNQGFQLNEIEESLSVIYSWYDFNIDFIERTPYVVNKEDHKSAFSIIEEIQKEIKEVRT